MTEPLEAVVSETASALIQNAQRLGLTWQMRTATVAYGTNPAAVSAILDGDSVPIGMVSTIGPLGVGQRVYVTQVPPSGNFVTGLIDAPGQFVTRKLLTASAATITLNIPAAVTVLDIYWTLRSDEGPGVAAAGSFQINGSSAAGYITRYWQVANTTGSAGTHTQSFGTTSALFGIYPTGAATSGRYGGGHINFQGWNDPHSGSITWVFHSGEENALNAGVFLDGEGIFTVTGPYTSIVFTPGAAGNWVSGSQITAVGVIAP